MEAWNVLVPSFHKLFVLEYDGVSRKLRAFVPVASNLLDTRNGPDSLPPRDERLTAGGSLTGDVQPVEARARWVFLEQP